MNGLRLLLTTNIIVFYLGICVLFYSKNCDDPLPIVIAEVVPQQNFSDLPLKEINYEISNPVPSYLDYQGTIRQLREWAEEAPALTSVGTYGRSTGGKDLYYIKVGMNESNPVILITACIHGNESLSASTVMAYIGTILDKYGDDDQITRLVDTRQIYFIPIVSPDSYPNSRDVDGVDPNRDFPTLRNPDKRSVPPVQALREFFLKIAPSAVVSGHTSGRVYLKPWGDQLRRCNNDDDYERIMGRMCELSGYRLIKGSDMYGYPIFGTELDWYYRNGAFSTVMEFGQRQGISTDLDIKQEFETTFAAVLYFIEEAPKVQIKQYSLWDWRIAA